MHLAAAHDDEVIALLLLRKGARSDTKNKGGYTALALAPKGGVAARIITRFGNQNTINLPQTEHTKSSIQPITGGGVTQISLFDDNNGRSRYQQKMESSTFPLDAAAYLGLNQLVEKLDSSTNLRDNRGCTLLMKASYCGHTDLVRKMLSALPRAIDQTDFYGNTALIWAVIGGHVQIAKILGDSGANVNGIPIVDSTTKTLVVKSTPLTTSAYMNCLELVEYFLEKGAQIDAKVGVFSRTAIYISCVMRHLPIVTLLLAHNCTVEVGIETWLTTGIINLKKQCIDSNNWTKLATDGKLQTTNPQAASQATNSVTTGGAPGNIFARKNNIHDKFVYCSPADIAFVSSVTELVRKRDLDHSNPINSIQVSIPVEPAALTAGTLSGGEPALIARPKKRHGEQRQAMNLDVSITLSNTLVFNLGV